MNDEYLRNATNDLRIHTATPFHQNDATPQRRHLKNFSVIFPQQENFDVSFWRRFRIFDRSCPPPPQKVVKRPLQSKMECLGPVKEINLFFPLILASLAASTMAFVSEESKCQASWAQLDVSRLRFSATAVFDFMRPEPASRYFSAGRIESGAEEAHLLHYAKNKFSAGV